MVKVLFIILFLLIAGCAQSARVKESRILMGTLCEVEVVDLSEKEARAAIRSAFRELERVDRLMSNYKESSEINRVNRLASSQEVVLSQHTFRVLESSLWFSELTSGALDITVFPLVKLWGFFDGRGRVPATAVVAETLSKVGYRWVQLDRDKRTVRYLKPGVEIDLGAAAKGYAADLALDRLLKRGVRNGLVNVGGNLVAIGGSSSRKGWVVGIRHPRKDKVFGTLFLNGFSVATSGDYERFFEADGKRYSHVLNPKTGYPVNNGIISVSTAGRNGLMTDLASTAIYVGGEETARRLQQELHFLEYVIVSEKEPGSLDWAVSPGMRQLFRGQKVPGQVPGR